MEPSVSLCVSRWKLLRVIFAEDYTEILVFMYLRVLSLDGQTRIKEPNYLLVTSWYKLALLEIRACLTVGTDSACTNC